MTMDFPQEIIDFYTQSYDEGARLKRGLGLLEHTRIQELIRRFIPTPPAVICDVGGGTGVHSFWLAGLGYEVHLVDIVPRHIELAKEAAQAPGAPRLASLQVSDARRLNYAAQSADAVLLFGPLYHLTERKERLAAIAEARRVLRVGGVLLAYALSRYASTIYGLRNGLVWDTEYLAMITEELTTGQHRKPPNWKVLTTAFFHHPAELEAELEEVGLACQGIYGIQGPGWIVPDFEESMQDEGRRETLLKIARLMEKEAVMSPHMLAVARRME